MPPAKQTQKAQSASILKKVQNDAAAMEILVTGKVINLAW